MSRFVVRVRDVNGREYIPDFFVARFNSKPAANEIIVPSIARILPGVAIDLPIVDNTINFSVGTNSPGFSGETFNLRKIGERWLADSRAVTIRVQGDIIIVDVVDGTIRLAPTIFIPPDQIVKDNPQALLCEPGQNWIYYGAWLANPIVNRLRNPVIFDTETPAGYPFDIMKVQNEGTGNLLFLEFGFDNIIAIEPRPRFLIAVWAPRIALGNNPQILVFYTPPTKPTSYPVDSYPFRNQYPYFPTPDVSLKPTVARNLVQPYAYLAINYLLAGYKIIPQIQAAGRNPIVIFPIHPSMKWGPLATQEGLSRLIKEVMRFLYARQIVSSRITPKARFSLDAGRASIFPKEGLFDDEIIPKSWSLTISGFSNGIDRVLDLCEKRQINEKLYDPAIFKSEESSLIENWREIWDIDGVANNGLGTKRHLDNFLNWMKEKRRCIRLYHSDEGMKTAPRSIVNASRIFTRPTTPSNGIYIEEGTRADGKATWVKFSNPALKPSPYDPHHTVPAVAFSHAAKFALP